MAQSISRTEKRGRGRPRTNPTSIHLTLTPELLSEIDAWIAKQRGPKLSRPGAVRQLLATQLKVR